jgi:hypothetical protein
MTRASVRVRDERGDFSITVCAENLRRAVEFAARRYPGHAVGLRFPLDPEAFFVERGLAWQRKRLRSQRTSLAAEREAGCADSGRGEMAPSTDPRDTRPARTDRVATIERRSPG